MNKFPSIKSLPLPEQQAIVRRKEMHTILLNNLGAERKDTISGFFGPESMTWQIYREPGILLGSMRALLLQIAHPAIASGVSQYSNFQKETIGRAHRTFTSMIRIWFGDTDSAIQSARRLYTIHSMIRGTAVWETEDENIFKPFCAADPDLLFWVLATMIDTTLLVFEKVCRPLSEIERNRFFEESKITAQLMGIPLDQYPSTLSDFYTRYNQTIENGTLNVGTACKEITKSLFQIPFPLRKFSEITVKGFLPAKLSWQFGFRRSRISDFLFKAIIWKTKWALRLIPASLRYAPPYHQANFRIAKAKGKYIKPIERFLYWAGKNVDLYFISNKLYPINNNK